jgi:hypothetical protein
MTSPLPTEPDCCGSQPPEFMTDSEGGQWRSGDCWCTLPADHEGLCRCELCAQRHGAPGWYAEVPS